MNLRVVSAIIVSGLIASSAQAQTTTNVAVLPFENSANDKATDYFASALTDEIAAALTKAPGVGVVGRSSIFTFRNPNLDDVSAALGTSYFVRGSASKNGDRVHVSAQLIRVAGDHENQRWSKDYDAAFSGIFDIEEGIAEHVAEAVGHPVRLARGEHLIRSRAKDMEAYDQYLHAKVVARGRGAPSLAGAEKLLETALARDPDFEPAAAMIAYDYALTPLFAPSLRGGRPDEERKLTDRLLPRAEAFALHAVMLNPKDAGAYVALGYVRLVQRKMLAAEDAFREALRLDPNQADGLHGYSQFLAAMGKIRDSLALRDHLQAIEPSIVQYTADTAEIYWLTGTPQDYAKAVAMLQPFRPGRTLELALIESAAGHYHDAAAALREMPASNWPDNMLPTAAKLLDTAPARNAPESLPKLGSLGFTYLHVGAPERVLEYYEDEVKGGYFQPISTTWFWHPSYAVVRQTERFKKLVRDLGLVEYWRARGWPAACHQVGADDFACV